MKKWTVSFCVIAYNEEKYISNLLNNFINQTYSKNMIEVILVDGNSQDQTKRIMQNFERMHSEYIAIKVLDNSKRVQPAGWNIAIKNATQDIILRIDAHAELPIDFIEKNVTCINSGEYVCGGPRPNIIDQGILWKKTLLSAERSMFGSSIAPYRSSQGRKYVNSVFHGAYRREIFNKVGLFNEELIRTEDNELHYRIRAAGYQICYDTSIVSYYHTRNSLRGMIKQKFSNGYWIGKTLFVCPKCISLYHLVPMCFLLSIFISAFFFVCGIKWMLCFVLCFYLIICILLTLVSLVKTKICTDLFLPIIFFLLHTSYGYGTLVGIFKGVNK